MYVRLAAKGVLGKRSEVSVGLRAVNPHTSHSLAQHARVLIRGDIAGASWDAKLRTDPSLPARAMAVAMLFCPDLVSDDLVTVGHDAASLNGIDEFADASFHALDDCFTRVSAELSHIPFDLSHLRFVEDGCHGGQSKAVAGAENGSAYDRPCLPNLDNVHIVSVLP